MLYKVRLVVISLAILAISFQSVASTSGGNQFVWAVAQAQHGSMEHAVSDPRRASIEGTLEALYQSFAFQPGEVFSSARISGFFMPGAVFVQPSAPNAARTIDHLDQFLADFERFVSSPLIQERGIVEEILALQSDGFGDIAQALVSFQPKHVDPSDSNLARGLDSFQLVRIEGRWWISSMSTQFESAALPLPKRFAAAK